MKEFLSCRGRLAQLVRASRLHRECRGFESLSAHQFLNTFLSSKSTAYVDGSLAVFDRSGISLSRVAALAVPHCPHIFSPHPPPGKAFLMEAGKRLHPGSGAETMGFCGKTGFRFFPFLRKRCVAQNWTAFPGGAGGSAIKMEQTGLLRGEKKKKEWIRILEYEVPFQ